MKTCAFAFAAVLACLVAFGAQARGQAQAPAVQPAAAKSASSPTASAQSASAQPAPRGFSPADSIYFIMTDRFRDGDSANNYRVRKDTSSAYQGGDFKGIVDKLDYVKALGYTAIWISPVVNNQGGGYHGYWAEDFYAAEEHFGTLQELKDLVAQAHARGLKVIIDLVVNHTGSLHPFLLGGGHQAWFNPRRDIKNWSNPEEVESGWLANLPDLDQNNPETGKYLIDMALWWIDQAGHDGYRLDTLRHVPQDFWRDFSAAIKAKYPRFYLIGEAFDGDFNAVAKYQRSGIDGLLDFPSYFILNEFLKKGLSGRDAASRLAQRSAYADPGLNGTFMDNHDVARFADQTRTFLDERLSQALLFVHTYTGIPVLYYGSEIPLTGSGDHASRTFMPWESGARFAGLVGTLNRLRAENNALRDGSFRVAYSDDTSLAYLRSDGKRSFLVVLNSGDKARNLTFDLDAGQPGSGQAASAKYAYQLMGEEWLGDSGGSRTYGAPTEATSGTIHAKARASTVVPADRFAGAALPSTADLLKKAKRTTLRNGRLTVALKPFTGALFMLE